MCHPYKKNNGTIKSTPVGYNNTLTDRVPVRVVKSLMVGLERSSVAAAASKCHVTVVKKRADDVTGVVVGQYEDETTA